MLLLPRKKLSNWPVYTGAKSNTDIGFSEYHIRVDLPSQHQADEEKLSLPWHQDGGYFKEKVCSRNSIVIWIPLFDCVKEDGCLEVVEGSHKDGIVHHDGYYVLPEQKKHYRLSVPDELVNKGKHSFAEAKAGDVNIFHFNLIHRSGKNTNSKVRYSLLVRASDLLSPYYVI
jgi:ectoine hydroxylase-related dioxygenase (phytanoyl-CoA dioxygenase family)